MYKLANSTVSVLRGSTTDVFGDEVASTTVHATGIPAQLTENDEVVADGTTAAPRVVRSATCYVPSTVDVVEGDRLRDDTMGGMTYVVDAVSRKNGVGKTPDVRLILRRQA